MRKIIIIPILTLLIFLPLFAQAITKTEACGSITDPVAKADCEARYDAAIFTSKEDITDLIVTITNWFAGIVFAIAVIMIIYGGVLYMTAAGSEEKAKTARRLLLYACIGIAVAMLAFGAKALIESFLKMTFVPTIFAADPTDEFKYDYTSPITSYTQVDNLIITATNWFAGIVMAIAVIMIIYGGVLYMTAAGSEEKAKTARRLLMYALIGIAVAILAFGAQFLVQSFLTPPVE